LLKVENIESNYGRINAIRGVSFEVFDGEIVTLLGANGAGKSTILKTIAGLIDGQPSKGMIRFEGRVINHMAPDKLVMLGISYIPEGREIFPELNVRENLKLGGYQIRERRKIEERMERIWKNFPVLFERQDQLAGTLSGGEQQMLSIARGLMAEPRLLMLDEPSMGLAPMMVKEIFRMIAEINRQGVTIILVEQNAMMALTIANRGYVLENGRIVLSGSSEQLRQNRDIQQYYLGTMSSRQVSLKRRKKRWR
jgi:branched-chain amino acid transport system ATP-binding protein